MSKRCPKPGDCIPPAPLVPVYNDGEFCSEVIADQCVVHTGTTLATIGASDGTKLSTILTNINNLLVPSTAQDHTIWESRDAVLTGIAPSDREQGILIPVRGEGNLITFYWFQGGTENVNLVPYETSLKMADALLLAGTTLDDANQKMTLNGTRWRLNDTEFSLTVPVPFNIPPADVNGLLRIDNIVGDFNGNVIYQTGVPALNAVPPDVKYKNILITTIYVTTDGFVEEDTPAYVPEGGVLFGFGDPLPALGKEGNSYVNQVGGQMWKKEGEDAVWNLKYTPPITTIGPLVDGRVTLSSGVNTVTDSPGLLFDRVSNQLKVNTTSTNSNYKLLTAGGFSLLTGVLNMDEYFSQFLMSGGRCAVLADGNGMQFRLFNNDNADFPDTSKSFTFRNKGFEHLKLYSDALTLNGQGQPTSWEFRTRLNYRLYLTHTAQNVGGAYRVLVRNSSTNEVESVDPATLGSGGGGTVSRFGIEDLTGVSNRTMNMGTYNLAVTGAKSNFTSAGIIDVKNTADGSAITATSVSKYGLSATSTSGVAVFATSTSGYAVQAQSSSGAVYGLSFGSVGVNGTSNATVGGSFSTTAGGSTGSSDVIDVIRNTTGGGAGTVGLGGAILYRLTGHTSSVVGSTKLISKWSTLASDGSNYQSDFTIQGIKGPSTSLQDLLTLKGAGTLRLHQYGTGTLTGTAAYNLATDASGNIIEVPASATTTASNGLIMTGTNAELGGALTKDTVISAGTAYNLAISGNFPTSTKPSILSITNSASNGKALLVTSSGAGSSSVAIHGTATGGGTGVFGTGVSGAGGSFSSGTGIGISVDSTSGIGAQIRSDSNYAALMQRATPTNTMINAVEVRALTTSVPATDGLGVAVNFSSNTVNFPTVRSFGTVGYSWTTAADASRTSRFEVTTTDTAVPKTVLTISGAGKASFPRYGSGTFTGTPTYNLATDAAGNIIEVAAGGGGGTTTAGNGLTKTGDNIVLGGTLLNDTKINTGSFQLDISSTVEGVNPLYVSAVNAVAIQGISTNQGGVSGQSTSGIGVSGSSSTNLGGFFNSTSSLGIDVASNNYNGYPSAQFTIGSGNGNNGSVLRNLNIRRLANGIPANGIGQSIVFDTQTIESSDFSNTLISKWINATHATRTSMFIIQGVNSGVNADRFIVKGNGVINIPTPTLDYADNAAAIAGGLVVGDIYRTGDIMKIVH